MTISIKLIEALEFAGYVDWSWDHRIRFVSASKCHTDIINGQWGAERPRVNNNLKAIDPEYYARLTEMQKPCRAPTLEELDQRINGMWGVYGIPSQPPPPPRKPVVSGERLLDRTCKRCKATRIFVATRPETTELMAICKLCGHEDSL